MRADKTSVTLQEDNGVAIIDLSTTTIERVFSTGIASNRPTGLIEDNRVSFSRDDGGALEATAIARGRYPEGRSENRGIETDIIILQYDDWGGDRSKSGS